MMVRQAKHLLLLFLLIVPALLFSACGPTPVFHCEAMPFYVQYKSITYYAVDANPGRALHESDLGSAITTVGNGQNQATSCQLDPGTQVYTVKVYQPTFRLAAHYNGITLFEVASNSQAKTGADLLDIDGKVQSISLDNTSVDSQGKSVTTSSEIKDPQQMDALLKMVLTAPVDTKHCQQQGNVQDITFHLKDGTATHRRYWTGSNEMQGCILLPKDFGVLLSSSQKNDIVGALSLHAQKHRASLSVKGQGTSLLPPIPMNYLFKWLSSSCSQCRSLLIRQGIAE